MLFSRLHSTALVLLVLLCALLLRLPLLTGSFWLDEAAQALESARPLTEQLNIRDDFQPPLLHLLTFITIRFNTAEWWLRTWGALIPGLISIWLTYKIGEKLFDAKTGLLAAIFLTTSSFHIFYSQELRPYSLPTLWAVLASYSLLQWMLHPQPGKQHTQQLIFTLSSLAGLYSSYLYPFFLFSQAAWIVLAQRKQVSSIFLSAVVIALGFLPWIPSFLGQLAAGTQVRADLPGWEAVVSIPQLKTIPLVLAKFVFGVLNLELTTPFVVFAVMIVGLLLATSQIAMRNKPKRSIFLVLWLIVPLLTAWIVSFWIPVIQPKRVLFLLPAFHLLAAGGIIAALQEKNKVFHYAGTLLAATLISINLYGTTQYYTQPTLQRENWRQLHADITRQYPPEKSVAVFSFPAPFAPWTWYDDGSYPVLATGALTTSAVPDLPNLLKTIADTEYVLVFDYLRDLTDPTNAIITSLESLGFSERQVLAYPNIGFVRVFTRQDTILSTTSL